MSIFPTDFLTRLEYLALISQRVFRGSLLAQKRTMELGSGIEFSDHREYTAGDDFRYLDWNIYARLGDLLLKRFQEEQDLHVYILLDSSRSMGFDKGRKFDLARQLAAALAYIALVDLDRIFVMSFAETSVEEFPLTRGKARILPLLRFLDGLETTGSDTSLSTAAAALLQRGSRRGLAVIISDLFDPRGFQRALDQLRHRRFDCHVIQLHTAAEADPGLLGDVELVDVENEQPRKVTVTERNLKAYKQLFTDHQLAVRDYCRQYGLGCTQAEAKVPFDELILQMMRASQLQR